MEPQYARSYVVSTNQIDGLVMQVAKLISINMELDG